MVTRQPKGVNRADQPKLLDVIEWTEHDADGTPVDGVTVGDRIIDSIRRNLGVNEACAAAGVWPQAYRAWLTAGAEVAKERAAMEAGVTPRRKLSTRDSAVWWFYQQVEQAKAEAERRLVHAVDARGTGDGLIASVVTRKLAPDPSGTIDPRTGQVAMVELERTEKRNRVLPDAAAAEWLLTRRHPERWGGTATLEVMGTGAGQVEHHHTHSIPALEDMLGKVAAKIEGRVTDTTATEVLPDIPPLGPDSQPDP